MLRQSLLRASLPRARPFAAPLARRWASTQVPDTTHTPTRTSGTPTELYGPPQETSLPSLPPGEEIDPQLNGYPQLPYVSLQTRPAFGWWDQQERKNFGEVVHEEEDALGMWGPDVHKISGGSALLQLIVAFSLVGAAAYVMTVFRPLSPVTKRDYPYNGLEAALGGYSKARVEDESDVD